MNLLGFAKSSQNSNYCLSQTQHSQFDSSESVISIEKSDLNQLIRSGGQNFSILTTKFDLKTKSNTEV